MKTTPGKYPLDQSPLFKLYSTPKFCRLLGINRSRLEYLLEPQNHYNVFNKVVRGKVRKIEAPKILLASVHTRIFELLGRIDTPEYLHSGIKGRSYITNANSHDGTLAGFKLDIKTFYPSTKWRHIYECFRGQFRCSHGVAQKLATLLTIDGHLPTGSPVSQCLAFFTHREMFERIQQVVEGFGGRPTVYVDDLYVSIGHVKRWHLKRVGRIINSHGLEWHKERVYRAGSPKMVTGVVLARGSTRLPNSKHLKLKDAYDGLRSARDRETQLALARSISGQLSTGSQVESRLRNRALPARAYQRHLERR